MGTEAPAPAPAPATAAKKPPPPPALFLVRARSRASRVADLGVAAWPSGPPDTPPRRSPVTVPFLWEEAPGKPKAPPQQQSDDGGTGTGAPAAAAAAAANTTTPATGAGDRDNGGREEEEARPAPLKLPPRLQRVASAKQQRDGSPSPRTVLPSPHYYGCAGGGRRPPRRTGSGFASFRRTPSAGAGLFSRSKTTAPAAGTKRNKGGGGGGHDHLSAAATPDAPWGSPAASSASSSSSLSASCFGDDPGPGHRRPADGREDGSSEEDECAAGSVRITRFRRNRSLPAMTTSHLWASIRKSFKQITPWS
ncbi:translation initiation factor IF-2-like [Panicum virgatum]|uniref:Uncharacterized protein n=1 Tax=Panicum virgatum TaxID=38727 RepID=A0A8T0SQ88_PANVG|nr:translation initiation factor IF-2-like [Panicum virgatum]KAG2598329.1 hypothetical protein PVAP13_5KG363200 [Panicum virgatum]